MQKPDTPFVTIVKLADQEIYDVVRYLNRQKNNSSTKIVSNTTPRALATESTTTVPPKMAYRITHAGYQVNIGI